MGNGTNKIRVVLLIVSVVSLYFIITSVQNYLEALKNLEEANKNVRESARELQHYVLEGEKEEQYYFSKGCTKQNDAMMACPIGTPAYQVKDYAPQE
jgi:hypothetical protein